MPKLEKLVNIQAKVNDYESKYEKMNNVSKTGLYFNFSECFPEAF